MSQTIVEAIPREKPTNQARADSNSSSWSASGEAKWRLVLAHAPTTDFLYGVLSTHIFCRPSCPSRRPRRANVRFFDTAAKAAAAGFRACRRCKPESTDAADESPQASAAKQVGLACTFIQQRKGDAQLVDIAAHVGLSPRYFHGLFKQFVGTTPGVYAANVRQKHAAQASVAETPPSLSAGSGTPISSLTRASGTPAPSDGGAQPTSYAGAETDVMALPSLDLGATDMSLMDFSTQMTMENPFPESFDPCWDYINFGDTSFQSIDDWALGMSMSSDTHLGPCDQSLESKPPEYIDPLMLTAMPTMMPPL
ncbi:metal binding domain of Ada-domain-containing protein [Xylariaceae sp. FL1019]|nr:metal binding domain of Ada-domain-containing protein [Xylariaceae sp. FL1019]